MNEQNGCVWYDVLRDGRRVVVRSIRADDVPRVAEFIDGLSSESRHLLFLGGIVRLGDAELKRLCGPASTRDVAFVAVDAEDAPESLIGLVRYASASGTDEAEISVAVADRWRHKGLGTLLLKHLIEHARAHGVRRLYSQDSASNYRMHTLARHLGFECHADPEDAREVTYTLTLNPTSAPRAGTSSG